MQYAVLIDLLDWCYSEDYFQLDERLYFANIHKHLNNQKRSIEDLYKKLCLEDRVDNGEPFNYTTAVVLIDMEEENDPSFSPSHSQYSISTLLLNILTILNGGVLGTSRVIASQDDFETSWGTYLLYENQTEFIYDLITYKGKFDEAIASQLKPIWENLKATWKKNESNPRINNVLDFFYFSWHTLTLQQTMICLSIVLETLFAPHSNTELVHQISFNVAKFLGKNELDRMEIYKYIKKYYSIRSKLVHGETISEDDLKSIPEFFKFTCNIILKIISDAELIHIFNNNQLRKIYIEQQLFN